MLKIIELAEDIQEGNMLSIVHEKKTFLVARLDGKLYAVDGKCTHLRCRLSDGHLEGTIVTCPCHGSRFDLRTGKVVQWIGRWPKFLRSITQKMGLARELKTYTIISKEDGIYLDLG